MLQAFFHAWERRLASVDHRSRRPPFRMDSSGFRGMVSRMDTPVRRGRRRSRQGAAFLGFGRDVGYRRVLYAGPDERTTSFERPPTEADS